MNAAREWGLVVLVALAGASRAPADEAVRMRERFPVGYQYEVRTRVDLVGTLTPPAVKGKPAPKPLAVRGDSAIEYHERVLAVGSDGKVSKTMRLCRRTDLRRTMAEQPQSISLRPAVRRLVLLRRNNIEVPFSPDGPLTWGEIDLIRTDVFTPALVGLLPDRPVRVGERWTASTAAVQELTDMERIEEGRLECRLARVLTSGKRRLAEVTFSGTVRGVNEDGSNRQKLQGHLHFDLGGNYLSYLQFKGASSLLGKDGREVGRNEGRFVMVREVPARCRELDDASLKKVGLEPNDDNTRLLYDDRDLGVRFLYPRRWRVLGVRGSQVILDGADGSGLLLTLDPVDRVPTGAAFLAESRDWLQKQKAKLLRVVPPQSLRASPPLEHFALEAEMGGSRFWMDYYVTRQANGGATLAVRLLPRDLAALRQEAARLARSIVVTKKISAARSP